MNRRVIIVAIAGLLVWCVLRTPPPSDAPPPPSKPAPSSPVAAKIPLLLFTQEGCPPCATIHASFQNAEVQALVAQKFDFSEVTPPDDRYQEYGVNGTPTLVALLKGGPKKRVGAASPSQLLTWLQSLDGKTPAPDNKKPRRPRRPSLPPITSSIVEGGNVGPGGIEVQVDLPEEMWKHNVTSRGQGCCVFRSIDHAAHWQNVPELWGFPEWLQKKGLSGGGYPGNVTERIKAICKERGVPETPYIQYEGGKDTTILELALATGRLPGITYDGMDGVHYHGRIAHMTNLAYLDDKMAAILDNNFPPDKLLWMSRADFLKRWSGWAVILLAPRPPAPPHN